VIVGRSVAQSLGRSVARSLSRELVERVVAGDDKETPLRDQ